MNANEILTYIASKIAPDSFDDDKEIPNGKSLFYTSDMGVVTRVPNHRVHHRTLKRKFGIMEDCAYKTGETLLAVSTLELIVPV